MISQKRKKVYNYYKLLIIQLYGYLAITPFIFAFFSIIKKYSLIDITIFATGLFFILILLLINHLEPSVKITPRRVILFNIDRNIPIIIYKNRIKSIKKINELTIEIHTNNKSYQLKLRKKQVDHFLNVLKELS
jgi:hypothetical protein